MSRFNDYLAATLAGMGQGLADLGRSAVEGVGQGYQEVLLADASVSPSRGLPPALTSAAQEPEPIAAPQAPAPDMAPPEAQPDVG